MKLKQLPKDGIWTDESGVQVPYNRTTPAERLKEKEAFALLKDAQFINTRLSAFKAKITEVVEIVLDAARKENGVALTGKGNYTWYNFNKSIKIEVNINEPIRFNEIEIEAAKEILFGIIRSNISGDDFVIGLVEDAFQTSSGKLDTKKVLGLKKHSSRIKNQLMKAEWDRAMNVIDKAISRPQTKTYFKVWLRNNAGEYENIDLNFSAI